MARPREYDAARALDDIQRVFWARGYHGTSLQDLEAATGLRKQTLYREFGNKDAMYARALALYLDRDVGALIQGITGEVEMRPRLTALFNAVLAPVRAGDRSGCFLCNASVDHAGADPAIAEMVQNGLEATRRLMADTLALDARYRDDDAARRAASIRLTTGYFGLRVMIRAGTPLDQLETVAQTVIDNV